MFNVKVAVVGPASSGKSYISNFLADQTEIGTESYRPTQGCRILEYEEKGLNVKGRTLNADVELWDCAGDKKFEGAWSALAKDAVGVVLVFNPDNASHIREIEEWYGAFVESRNLRESNVIIFAHSTNGGGVSSVVDSARLSRVPVFRVNIEDKPQDVKNEFKKFIKGIVAALSERSDQDELNIVNSR